MKRRTPKDWSLLEKALAILLVAGEFSMAIYLIYMITTERS